METNQRNKIVNRIRDLLDEDYTDIQIRVFKEGFSIIPSKEITPVDTKANKEVKE